MVQDERQPRRSPRQNAARANLSTSWRTRPRAATGCPANPGYGCTTRRWQSPKVHAVGRFLSAVAFCPSMDAWVSLRPTGESCLGYDTANRSVLPWLRPVGESRFGYNQTANLYLGSVKCLGLSKPFTLEFFSDTDKCNKCQTLLNGNTHGALLFSTPSVT